MLIEKIIVGCTEFFFFFYSHLFTNSVIGSYLCIIASLVKSNYNSYHWLLKLALYPINNFFFTSNLAPLDIAKRKSKQDFKL